MLPCWKTYNSEPLSQYQSWPGNPEGNRSKKHSYGTPSGIPVPSKMMTQKTSSMDSVKRFARTSVVWLPSKGKIINVYFPCFIFHYINQHQGVSFTYLKIPWCNPKKCLFHQIRKERKKLHLLFFGTELPQKQYRTQLILDTFIISDSWWMDAQRWTRTLTVIFTG